MTVISDVQPAPASRFSRLKKFAPFLLLGPISGPLAAAMVHHYREGRPVLASLYGIAMVAIIVLLPVITAALGVRVL
jgi:hypothetical protein